MNIIVLSRNPSLYSTQSITRAARQRGHNVRILDHMQCDIIIDNGEPKVLYNGQNIRNVDAIIPRIGSSATTYGSAIIRQFETMGVFTTVAADDLLNARDKITCLQMLAGAGVGVPTSALSNNPYTFGSLINQVGPPPIILKLVKGTHGLGVIKCDDQSTAESVLEAFYKTKDRTLIQRFIPEAKGADVRVFIVDQEIVGVMKRQARPGEFRSNLHRGGSSKVIPLTDRESEVALKAAEVMGLSVAGVDMLQSHSGPQILEVNASPGLEGIETTTKVNIAGKIIAYVEKNVNKR